MREGVTKCKVAKLPFLWSKSELAYQAAPGLSTRRRKLAAEAGICGEWNLSASLSSAQRKRAKVKMTGKTSPQKRFLGQMKASFALHDSFAHFRPYWDMTTIHEILGHLSRLYLSLSLYIIYSFF